MHSKITFKNRKYIILFLLLLNTLHLFSQEKLIQIAIEVVEVNINKTYEFGIQWIDTIRFEETFIPVLFNVADFVRLNKIYADLKLLMSKGAADLLANPKLVTKEGTTATFKAGGEIPYAVSTTQGATNVQFKPYGVTLNITPRIKGDYIDISLKAGVSVPDDSVAVTLSGNTVPGILDRTVSSEINIKQGTTLTIAGLVQTRKETVKKGIPLLGEIPFLGTLFSYNKVVNKKTSVVIFLTPTVVTTE